MTLRRLAEVTNDVQSPIIQIEDTNGAMYVAGGEVTPPGGGTVTNSGTLINNNLLLGNGGTQVKVSATQITTDGTLGGNSDGLVPTEKAVKTYADTKQSALGFTPENTANKDTDGTLAADSDTKYASQKATKTYADTKATPASVTTAIAAGPPQHTVATLPAGAEGAVAYATDGLKVGETTGNGTGVPVYFSNAQWRVYSTDLQVAA